MSDNLTQQLLRDHLIEGELVPGTDIVVRADQVLLEDATATMAAMQFEMLGASEVAVPLAVVYVDHNVLQIDDKNMQDHRYLRSFCAKYGLRYSPAGNGISHYLHLERFGKPGELIIGADSHTTMAGALGMFATGAGGLDVAITMAGHGAELTCPRVIGVELVNSLSNGVEAKDIILELLRRRGVRGGRGAVFEFYGEGVGALSVAARGTIANMIVETGATGAVFPSDEQTRLWLSEQQRAHDYRPLQADAGAAYEELEVVDLSRLVPLVALPHSPGNVVPVTEVEGTELVQVCVGSSVNSSYDDLATVAAALRGNSVAPGVQVTVTPGSRQILETVSRSGVYQDLLAAGAQVLEPICGPCVGIGQAPVRGKPSLRTFNRNFPGRSGTAEDEVYLCSPSTAAVSALTGRITDPRSRCVPRPRPPVAPHPSVVDLHITAPLPAGQREAVQVERGENLVSPPLPDPLPDEVRDKVGIVLGDDISTGDMAPDGVIAMAVWSNIAKCATFMFRRNDPDFYGRVKHWGGGLVVAGENYGQGSSREHAALSPLFLGIRVIVAAGYARIHRRNLIAVGIVPLLFKNASDREKAKVGQEWHIPDLATSLRSGHSELTAFANGQSIPLLLDLSPRERETLLAGGRLNQLAARQKSL